MICNMEFAPSVDLMQIIQGGELGSCCFASRLERVLGTASLCNDNPR
jgi:hypothetical protein